jgi:HEAT repeat protein
MTRTLITAVTLSLVFGIQAAAQPRLSNGEVRTTPLNGTLSRAAIEKLGGAGPAWVGYAVPIVAGDHQMCCWSGDSGGCCSGCRLENRSGAGPVVAAPPTGPIKLEGSTQLFVLYRVENGAISKIRMFSEDCALDGGGLALHWLTGVRAGDSIAVLGTFASESSSRSLADGALSALAMHADPAALERLITAARQGSTTHLRGQALFWLAQRAGDKAIGTISDAIDKDPETEVKRRAVFALSQLPKDEGVPRLIQLARTNGNPVVRKQAMFWLGQSNDPRALKFFEEILFK